MTYTDDTLVVVDYECMSPLGSTFKESWQRAVANESGIGWLDRYAPHEESLQGVKNIKVAGQIPGSYADIMGSEAAFKRWPDPSAECLRKICRLLLVRQKYTPAEHNPLRLSVIGGSSLTSASAHDEVISTGKPVLNALLTRCSNIPLSMVAMDHQFQGPSFNVSGACASSNQALILAGELIKAGTIDAALVCGFEFPLRPVNVAGFSWLSVAFSTRHQSDRAFYDPAKASRPFSMDRRGLVLSEGCGAVLITRESYREKMGWSAKGIIRGSCMNADAASLISLTPKTVIQCMQETIARAGLYPEDVECINAHATSTRKGDRGELQCLNAVFGKRLRQLPIVANKSQIGHALGASSLFGVMFSLEGMRKGVVLPTLNYSPDEEHPVASFSSETIAFEHQYTLANSFGFGGANACLLLERLNRKDII